MSDSCCEVKKANGKYDLAVIGAGSAGFSAAITAADQGATVALIGNGTIGGTCVNVGCVPSKALIRAAESIHQANSANRFGGVQASGQLQNWKLLRDQKDELVSSLREAKYIDVLANYSGVSYIEGAARIVDDGVTVGNRHIKAKKIIIATGSHEFIPPIPGVQDTPYLTSTTAFELEALPESMMVIGGGYIGCEIAQMFSRLGVKITLLFRSSLLPEAEPEISQAIAEYFEAEGITVLQVNSYDSVSSLSGEVSLSVSINGKTQAINAEKILFSAGRKANIDGLGLEEEGIACTASGAIHIDEQMRTTKEGVYAAGDVTGVDQFVYMAAYGAKIASHNAMGDSGRSYDNSAMPSVVFTDPQVASVGLTEAAARSRGVDTKVSVLSLDNVPRALAARDIKGLIKLVADRSDGKLLGAHIIAPEGADSIQTAALAIKQGMTYTELGNMIFPYLTTVEGLKLAAQTFDMEVSKLSCCAG
ncbi:mercury(II) reductase [Sneathiella aquimaris]|uniref:mercury(II) reductase n=1 Tax=Sneathiella aquimaris TaxID=2599305 RepID=UPI00146B7BD8|nr:mercury(II) reductase [Sneathiella aquimaris]